MSVSQSNNKNWLDLIKKTKNRSFLGNITTRWTAVNRGEDCIKISLCKAKFLSSLVCSILLFIFLLVILTCSKRLYGVNFIFFSLPFIWLFVGSLLGCKRIMLWAKGDDKIKLVSGIFPIKDVFFLSKNEIFANLEWLDQSKTSVVLYLYNREYPDSKVKLIRSAKRSWVVPVFNQLKEVLGSSCVDETY